MNFETGTLKTHRIFQLGFDIHPKIEIYGYFYMWYFSWTLYDRLNNAQR